MSSSPSIQQISRRPPEHPPRRRRSDPAHRGKNIRKGTSGTSGVPLRFEHCNRSETWRQAARLHRLEMRPAHDAGHLMSGQRQPHRKMTADGARAENAYPHGRGVPVKGSSLTVRGLVSTSLPASATGAARPWAALDAVAKIPHPKHDRRPSTREPPPCPLAPSPNPPAKSRSTGNMKSRSSAADRPELPPRSPPRARDGARC